MIRGIIAWSLIVLQMSTGVSAWAQSINLSNITLPTPVAVTDCTPELITLAAAQDCESFCSSKIYALESAEALKGKNIAGNVQAVFGDGQSIDQCRAYKELKKVDDANKYLLPLDVAAAGTCGTACYKESQALDARNDLEKRPFHKDGSGSGSVASEDNARVNAAGAANHSADRWTNGCIAVAGVAGVAEIAALVKFKEKSFGLTSSLEKEIFHPRQKFLVAGLHPSVLERASSVVRFVVENMLSFENLAQASPPSSSNSVAYSRWANSTCGGNVAHIRADKSFTCEGDSSNVVHKPASGAASQATGTQPHAPGVDGKCGAGETLLNTGYCIPNGGSSAAGSTSEQRNVKVNPDKKTAGIDGTGGNPQPPTPTDQGFKFWEQGTCVAAAGFSALSVARGLAMMETKKQLKKTCDNIKELQSKNAGACSAQMLDTRIKSARTAKQEAERISPQTDASRARIANLNAEIAAAEQSMPAALAVAGGMPFHVSKPGGGGSGPSAKGIHGGESGWFSVASGAIDGQMLSQSGLDKLLEQKASRMDMDGFERNLSSGGAGAAITAALSEMGFRLQGKSGKMMAKTFEIAEAEPSLFSPDAGAKYASAGGGGAAASEAQRAPASVGGASAGDSKIAGDGFFSGDEKTAQQAAFMAAKAQLAPKDGEADIYHINADVTIFELVSEKIAHVGSRVK